MKTSLDNNQAKITLCFQQTSTGQLYQTKVNRFSGKCNNLFKEIIKPFHFLSNLTVQFPTS